MNITSDILPSYEEESSFEIHISLTIVSSTKLSISVIIVALKFGIQN